MDAQVWRDHLSVPDAKELAARIDQVQQSGVRALIPGDSDYGPSADAAVRTQRTRCGTIAPDRVGEVASIGVPFWVGRAADD